MLDKSVPHVDILMHRPAGLTIPPVSVPAGFRAVLYMPGDARAWAEIETAVLEFNDVCEALAYFERSFLAYPGETERRCLFLETDMGEKVATASTWWAYSGKRRDPWLHWVAVKPEYQGLGLGKAIVAAALSLMQEIEGDCDSYLHTQTWSHRAVGVYEKMGFTMTDATHLSKYRNERFEEAVRLLTEIRGVKPRLERTRCVE